MTISDLYIYPIKSLGGLSVKEAVIEAKGFRYDRRFMLVSPNDNGSWDFMTQRTNQQMTWIDVAMVGSQLHVWHRNRPDDRLTLPLDGPPAPDALAAPPLQVNIWDSYDIPAVGVSTKADTWFSTALGQPCRLVFMPETTHRPVEEAYARHNDVVSFADGFPYLLIGQASLDDLNRRLPAKSASIEMRRFRPNIVVAGSLPYEEDSWHQFRIDGATFYGVKPCARCVLTTIDPATGQKGPEPLRTLATYRQWKHKILFGQNVLAEAVSATEVHRPHVLRVGQAIEVFSRREPWLAPPVPFSSFVS